MSGLNKKNGNLRGVKGLYFDTTALDDENDIRISVQGWPVFIDATTVGFVLVLDSETYSRRLEITLTENALIRITEAVDNLRPEILVPFSEEPYTGADF